MSDRYAGSGEEPALPGNEMNDINSENPRYLSVISQVFCDFTALNRPTAKEK
jgi:hypothetical protein